MEGLFGGFGTQSFERPIVGERIPYMDAGYDSTMDGVTGSHANSVAPLLISTEQGYFKSTFCKSLLPPALQRYYMDKVDLTSQGHIERRLAEMGLLNLDEFDKYAPTKMPLLKNLMQMASLSLCKTSEKLSLATSYSFFYRDIESKRFID